MKKNIFTVIIFALTLVNVVLSAFIIFTIVPTVKKNNVLVNQISSLVNLELEGKMPEEEEEQTVVPKDIEPHKIEMETTTKTNLKRGSDNRLHYAIYDSITLSLNKKSEDYKTAKASIEKNESIIIDKINDILSSYTIDVADSKRDEIKEKALKSIQEYFQTEDFIYNISIGNLVFQ